MFRPTRTLASLACAAVLLLLTGCSSTRPAEPFPGIGDAPGVDRASLVTIREANHVFIDSIDDRSIPQLDVNDLSPGPYRQFQVPPGNHTLSVFYREPNNLELITAGPRQILVHIDPGTTYSLRPNRIGFDTTLGSSLRVADWRPELVRDASKTSAGIAAADR